MNELVSIVMPAYNSADHIRAAIDSCLAQTHDNIELIVIDDGSTDETVQIVQSYGDDLRLIQQPNQGPAIARNTGIQAATGDYIQFCDSDDLLHPEKIERSLMLLHEMPDAPVAYTRVRQVAEDGVTSLGLADFPPDDYYETTDLFCKILAHMGSPIQTSTLLIRKSALEAVGMYRADPDQRCAEDWDLLLRLSAEYALVGIRDVLVYYRHHSETLTTNNMLMAQGRLQTTIYAQDYPAWKTCLSDEAYRQLLAGRYHHVAMLYWRYQQTRLARQHFAQAIKLTPQARPIRQIMHYASYIMSAQMFENILSLLGVSK